MLSLRIRALPLLAALALSSPAHAETRTPLRFSGGFVSGTPTSCEALLTGYGRFRATWPGGPQGAIRMRLLLSLAADGRASVQLLLEARQQGGGAPDEVFLIPLQGFTLRAGAHSAERPTLMDFADPLGGASTQRRAADATVVRNFIHAMLAREIVYATLRPTADIAEETFYGPVRWDIAEGAADERRVRDCMSGLATALPR